MSSQSDIDMYRNLKREFDEGFEKILNKHEERSTSWTEMYWWDLLGDVEDHISAMEERKEEASVFREIIHEHAIDAMNILAMIAEKARQNTL